MPTRLPLMIAAPFVTTHVTTRARGDELGEKCHDSAASTSSARCADGSR